MSLGLLSPPDRLQPRHGVDAASSVTGSSHSGSTGHGRSNSSTSGSQTSVSSFDEHAEGQEGPGRANETDIVDVLEPQLSPLHAAGNDCVTIDKIYCAKINTAGAPSADRNERHVEDDEVSTRTETMAHVSSNSSEADYVEDSGPQDRHYPSGSASQPSIVHQRLSVIWESPTPGEQETDASLQSVPKDLRMDIRGWQALQNRATRQPAATLSSVAFQVRNLLHQKERQGTPYKIKAGHKCLLCSRPIGDTREAIFIHARAHWTRPMQPKYECWVCGIDFAFEKDYRHHRQHHRQDQFLSECEELFATNDDSWLRRALLQKFESDLRLWEKFQLLQYLDIVDVYLGRTLSDRYSSFTETSDLSDTSTSSLFIRWSITSLNSCPSRIQPSNGKTDISTLLANFRGVKLGSTTPSDFEGNEASHSESENLFSVIQKSCPVAKSPLARALRKGRMTGFREIISRRNHHICGMCERFALCTAAMNGDVEALSALLDAGMSPNIAGPEVIPFRPLDLAMCRGRIKVAEILLEKGAIIKRTKRYHATFWMLAARENLIPLAKEVLKAGLNPDFQLDNEPLLLRALRHGSSASVILLLNYCSDVNTKGKDGRTALHVACTKGSTGPVKLLLEAGGDVGTPATSLDTHGMTPLMFAAANRRLDVVKLLLAHKANVNSLDVLGRTALHHACDHTEKQLWPDAQIVRALLAAGAEVDRQDVSGQTALMYAARTGTLKVVSDLLAVGAEIGIKAHSGLDAQGMARVSGNVMLEKLLEDAAKERRGWL